VTQLEDERQRVVGEPTQAVLLSVLEGHANHFLSAASFEVESGPDIGQDGVIREVCSEQGDLVFQIRSLLWRRDPGVNNTASDCRCRVAL
jgi:hypothetical protein